MDQKQVLIANKYPGRCRGCGTWVPARAGHAAKNGGSQWYVLCGSDRCAAATGIDVAVAQQQHAARNGTQPRTLRQEGDRLVVSMAKDPAALPLLRSLPARYFDFDRRVWTCSARYEDRRRVLEIADQLELDVPAALRDLSHPVVDRARARAEAIEGIRPYQIDGVAWLASRKQALLGDDMGLGKTLQILVALPENARAIAIVPKSVKYTWRDEGQRWRPDLTVTPLHGRGSFRLPREGEIVTINFALLPPLDEIGKLDLAGITLIVDEAQGCKNYRAKRSKQVQALSYGCAATWLLTGTPLMNRPPDLYGLLQAGCMAGRTFGKFASFAAKMGGHKGRWGWEWPDYERRPDAIAPEVPELLKRVMLRRTKAEVARDLPPKIRSVIHVNGEDAGLRKRLDVLWAEWRDCIESGELPPFEEFSQIRAELAASRIPDAIEQIEAYEDAENPLIVFSAHRKPVDTIGQRDGWEAITGDTSAERRAEIVAAFQSGALRGVALTIAAGGVGITLTRASHVLFVDWAWRPADLSQAEDRCCRIGQTADSVQIVSLVQDHPLEKALHALIRSKQAMIERAVEAAYQYTAPKADAAAEKPLFTEESEEDRERRIAEREQVRRDAEQTLEREQHADYVETVTQRQRGRGFDKTLTDLTDERREQIVGAYHFLLGRCDGAVAKDFAGFNKPDAVVAHRLGLFDFTNDNDLLALWSLLGKYHRQCKTNFPALY